MAALYSANSHNFDRTLENLVEKKKKKAANTEFSVQ